MRDELPVQPDLLGDGRRVFADELCDILDGSALVQLLLDNRTSVRGEMFLFSDLHDADTPPE